MAGCYLRGSNKDRSVRGGRWFFGTATQSLCRDYLSGILSTRPKAALASAIVPTLGRGKGLIGWGDKGEGMGRRLRLPLRALPCVGRQPGGVVR
jgi:hypothetical protein